MEEILSKLGVDWRLIIAQLANFGVLFFVLRKFVYKPVLKTLDERKERIARANEAANKAEENAAEAEALRQETLSEARKRSAEIIAEAEKDAEVRKAQILDEAEKEKRELEEKTRKALVHEREALRRELKSEMGDIVRDAVKKTVSDFADQETTKRLTDEALQILNEEHSRT